MIIVTLSTIQSLSDGKYCFLWFLAGGGLNQLVGFAFDLTNLVSCAYGASILFRKREDVNKMVQAMTIYEENWNGERAEPVFSFVLATLTVVLATAKVLLLMDLDEISTEGILLLSSHELSEDLFLWSSANLNTTTQELKMEFGTNLNSVTFIMGFLKILRNLASALFHGMMWDIIGNVVLVLLCWMLYFMASVHAVVENAPEENLEEAMRLQTERVVAWKAYRQIRMVFASVNEVIGPLLMLFHVTNVLRYAFFMEQVIYPDNGNAFTYIHLLYDIVKSEIVYLTATNIAQQVKLKNNLTNIGMLLNLIVYLVFDEE